MHTPRNSTSAPPSSSIPPPPDDFDTVQDPVDDGPSKKTVIIGGIVLLVLIIIAMYFSGFWGGIAFLVVIACGYVIFAETIHGKMGSDEEGYSPKARGIAATIGGICLVIFILLLFTHNGGDVDKVGGGDRTNVEEVGFVVKAHSRKTWTETGHVVSMGWQKILPHGVYVKYRYVDGTVSPDWLPSDQPPDKPQRYWRIYLWNKWDDDVTVYGFRKTDPDAPTIESLVPQS